MKQKFKHALFITFLILYTICNAQRDYFPIKKAAALINHSQTKVVKELNISGYYFKKNEEGFNVYTNGMLTISAKFKAKKLTVISWSQGFYNANKVLNEVDREGFELNGEPRFNLRPYINKDKGFLLNLIDHSEEGYIMVILGLI